MNIYQLQSDHTYRAFETGDKHGYKMFLFQGKPVENWTEIELYPSKHRTEVGKPIGDVYPVTVGTVVINEKAFRALEPYIRSHAQVLPATIQSQKVYVLNFTTVIDCLNRENSKVFFFSNSDRIMEIEKFAFYKDRLADAFAFKIPEEIQSAPFVTEKFKSIVEQNHIQGFKFVPVWQDTQY